MHAVAMPGPADGCDGDGAWLADRMLTDPVANDLIDKAIAQFNLPEVDFRSRARLHLPLLYKDFDSPSMDQIETSIEQLAIVEAQGVEPYRRWLTLLPESDLRDLSFRPLLEQESEIIFSKFHYLRSKRLDAQYWCLSEGLRVFAAAALSPFDLNHLGPLLGDIPRNKAVVLSRVYAFRGAPKNTLSFLLARMSELAAKNDAEIMLTYLNPNLGFRGASYRAANWKLFSYECGTRYQYIDKTYVTDRYLSAMYGTDDPTIISRYLGSRLELVSFGLAPLKIFAYYIGPKGREQSTLLSPRLVRRPT
jgi:hypothetical protein